MLEKNLKKLKKKLKKSFKWLKNKKMFLKVAECVVQNNELKKHLSSQIRPQKLKSDQHQQQTKECSRSTFLDPSKLFRTHQNCFKDLQIVLGTVQNLKFRTEKLFLFQS